VVLSRMYIRLGSMKKRESALWKVLSKCVPPDAMAVRIENSLDSGMPDVLLTCQGKTALIELKCDLKITSDQMDWARRWHKAGGESWFLIAIGCYFYLVPGSDVGSLMKKPATLPFFRFKNLRAALDIVLGAAK